MRQITIILLSLVGVTGMAAAQDNPVSWTVKAPDQVTAGVPFTTTCLHTVLGWFV